MAQLHLLSFTISNCWLSPHVLYCMTPAAKFQGGEYQAGSISTSFTAAYDGHSLKDKMSSAVRISV